MDGSLTRLLDPDTALRAKILEFIQSGEFGLASGRQPDSDYTRLWFGEKVSTDDVVFDSDVYLICKFKAAELKMKEHRGKVAVEKPPADQPSLDKDVLVAA